MDLDARNALSALVNKLTTTGLLTLDAEKLKDFKALCKKSDSNVSIAYELLLQQLKKSHSQIRYSCVLLSDELFKRSARFRHLLVADFPTFLQLTVGIHQRKLPPPETFAIRLKALSIRLVKAWFETHGSKLKQLELGYEHIRQNMQVDFEQVGSDYPVAAQTTPSAADRARTARLTAIKERQFLQLEEEINEKSKYIRENLSKMESCFGILVPNLDDDENYDSIFGNSSLDVDEPSLKETVEDSGLASSRYRLIIDLSTEENSNGPPETKENAVIYETLREAYKLLSNKHMKVVTDWASRIAKGAPEDRTRQQNLLKRVLDLKEDLRIAKEKGEELGADEKPNNETEDETEDEADFEEVHISAESPAPSSPSFPIAKDYVGPKSVHDRIFALQGELGLEEDVTVRDYDFMATDVGGKVSAEQGPELVPEVLPALDNRAGKGPKRRMAAGQPESREELLARAPIVEYREDLDYWDTEKLAFNTSGLEYNHRFLGTSMGDNEVSQETLARMKTRTIYYEPKRPTEIKACRHPLKTGKLCQRRDLVTCPFHGRIISRDEFGTPSGTEGKGKGRIPQKIVEEANGEANEEPCRVPFRDYDDEDTFDDVLEEVDVGDMQETGRTSLSTDTTSVASSSRTPIASANPVGWQDIEDDVTNALGLEKIVSGKKKGKRKGYENSALMSVSKSKEPKNSRQRIEKVLSSSKSRKQVNDAALRDESMKARQRNTNRW